MSDPLEVAFRRAWCVLAAVGKCDGPDGMEYERGLADWRSLSPAVREEAAAWPSDEIDGVPKHLVMEHVDRNGVRVDDADADAEAFDPWPASEQLNDTLIDLDASLRALAAEPGGSVPLGCEMVVETLRRHDWNTPAPSRPEIVEAVDLLLRGAGVHEVD